MSTVKQASGRGGARAGDRRDMTIRRATTVLIRQAARAFIGDGCGIRSGLSAVERDELQQAIEIVWPRVYGRPMDDSEQVQPRHEAMPMT